MKCLLMALGLLTLGLLTMKAYAQSFDSLSTSRGKGQAAHLFMDVHKLGPGKVTYKAVADAHAKDLAVEKQYGVQFLSYWVDEAQGLVYCLSSAPDTAAIRKTHAAAHGLLPAITYEVTDGPEAMTQKNKYYFLDVHELGAHKVTAADVAAAHEKDLAVQKQYGVNFINYWVDESTGTVVCLSQAADSSAVINTHKAAHGLVPVSIGKVKPGK